MFCWILLVVIASVVANGEETNNTLVREMRPLSSRSFDEVVVQGAFDVALLQLPTDANQTSSVEIETTAETQRHLLVEVLDGHILSIGVTGVFVINANPRVYIQFTGPLRRYTVSGSGRTLTGNMTIFNPKMEKLVLNKKGASIMVLNLEVHDFHGELAGVGLVQLAGRVREQAVFDISGSIEVDAMNLICQRSQIQVSGNSLLSVTAIDDIEIETSGMSQVFYQLRTERQPSKVMVTGMATITRVP